MALPLRDLHRELQECQRRLGTPEERPDDFERVLTLAHRLNNSLAGDYLEVLVNLEGKPGPSLVRFSREKLGGK